MVFPRQKSRADEDPESPLRNQTGINMCEVLTPIQKVFTQEQNELFVQLVLRYSQYLDDEIFYYHVFCLNESATVDGSKEAYRKLVLLSHR